MVTGHKIRRILEEAKDNGDHINTFRSLSYLLGFASVFMGSLPLATDIAWLGIPAGSEGGWHLRPVPFPLWEILFIGGGSFLVVVTKVGIGYVFAHSCAAITWLVSSLLWMAYGILFRPDYVFALGVFSLFMSAQHVILARVWIIEKVE